MSNRANSDMREFWDGDGGRKWLRFQDNVDIGFIPFGLEAMAAAAMTTGERVLDVGCGCGDTTFEIACRVGPHGHVQGIDISELILDQARSRAASAQQYNLSFECQDAQSHQFEPMEFDVVFSRFGVMFFDDPIAALGNIRQALKPGGRMAFVCWQPVKVNQWVSLPLEIAAKHVQLPPPYDPEEPGGFSFGDENRVRRMLTEAGFIDASIECFETQFNVAASLDEAVTFLTHMGPANSAIEAPDVDDTTRDRIVAELRDTLVSYETEQGVELGAATWIVTAQNPVMNNRI